jgi:hypothetical protein
MKIKFKIYILNVQDVIKLSTEHNLNYDTIVQSAIEINKCTNVLFGMDYCTQSNKENKFKYYLSEENHNIIF